MQTRYFYIETIQLQRYLAIPLIWTKHPYHSEY